MKIASVILGLLLAVFIFIQIRGTIINNYEMEIGYSNYWSLADKSSTLEAKKEYISKFEEALDHGYRMGKFAEYDAINLKTPDNSFSKNLSALRTLTNRLNEISKMDITSFQYNTAIEQITRQEQGEASAMLKVFSGCYTLENRPYLWGWIGALIIIFEIIMAFVVIPVLWETE
jgi:hypothetical protein